MSNGIVYMLYDKLLGPDAVENSLAITLASVSVIAVVGRLIYQYLTIKDDTGKFPLINGAKPWSLLATAEKMNFIYNAPKLFEQGLKTVGSFLRSWLMYRYLTGEGSYYRLGEYSDFRQTMVSNLFYQESTPRV